jgi:hypothetical protein
VKNYIGPLGEEYVLESEHIGFQCIPVLEFLKGKKWDEVALAYVHALRPSTIRVPKNEIKANAKPWRVTVILNEYDFIERIEQEVEVWLPDGVEHGQALQCALKYGIESEQCKWWKGATSTMYDGIITHKLYKYDEDGNAVPFPSEGPIGKTKKPFSLKIIIEAITKYLKGEI